MPNPKIINQDDQVLVVNKPSGLVVNRADSVKEPTLQDWIESTQSFKLSDNTKLRNGIVHRLDKDTSGVLLIAKTKTALENLQAQFRHRKVQKTYLALAHGHLKPKQGHISLPLGRSSTNRQAFTVQLSGKMSKTAYQVVDYYHELKPKNLASKSYQGFTLVSLYPKTGRTHQLRVILKHLGHPIVGDQKYTGKKRARADANWCKRQFLHALEIKFNHPQTNKPLNFKAKLSNDLQTSLDQLK